MTAVASSLGATGGWVCWKQPAPRLTPVAEAWQRQLIATRRLQLSANGPAGAGATHGVGDAAASSGRAALERDGVSADPACKIVPCTAYAAQFAHLPTLT